MGFFNVAVGLMVVRFSLQNEEIRSNCAGSIQKLVQSIEQPRFCLVNKLSDRQDYRYLEDKGVIVLPEVRGRY